jgi:hypothetical protein
MLLLEFPVMSIAEPSPGAIEGSLQVVGENSNNNKLSMLLLEFSPAANVIYSCLIFTTGIGIAIKLVLNFSLSRPISL